MKLLNKPLEIYYFFLFAVSMTACRVPDESKNQKIIESNSLRDTLAFLPLNQDSVIDGKAQKEIGKIEQSIIKAGLVNIRTLDSSIIINLKYSTRDNFLETDVYGDLEDAYLQEEVAEKLVKAQLILKSKFPSYRLIVYDAVRPRSIQQIMWSTMKIPTNEKIKYLSNPKYGSLHNYGAAVDISIIDEKNNELDMGTKYDCFDELAYPVKEVQFLREGKLSNQQIENRKLLREVMYGAGFFNIQTEWWHFNSCYRNAAIAKYKIVE